MVKIGGIEEAAKLLAGLEYGARGRILELIAKDNPEIAEELEKHLVNIEDLKFITVKMLQELLREIKLDDLGMALRIGSTELKEYILNNVSKTMAQDLGDILTGPPLSVSKVQEAIDRILDVVRVKVDKGELIISKADTEEYV